MKPKINPVGDIIFLEIEQANVGALATDSIKTGMEWATVKEVGPEVQDKSLKGKKVFVKGWSVDIIEYEGKPYYFTSEARKGICAVIT